MTSTTTAPEAEYWLQTGWMEEPGAEFGIRKPVTIDRKTNLYEHRAYWCVRRAQDVFFSLLALVVLSPLLLITSLAIWLDSPGSSPIFSQWRAAMASCSGCTSFVPCARTPRASSTIC